VAPPPTSSRTIRICRQAGGGTPPALICDRTGEPAVADHSSDVEVFHHDHRLGSRQRRGGLMQRVNALVADAAVQPCQRQRRLGAVLGASLLAADRSAAAPQPPQPPQVCRQRPRAPDLGAVRADRERGDPSVHPHHRAGHWHRVRPLHLDGQRAIPAIGLPPTGRRQDPPTELAGRLLGGDPTDPRQHHRPILYPDRPGQPEPLRAASPLLEPREPDPRPAFWPRQKLT